MPLFSKRKKKDQGNAGEGSSNSRNGVSSGPGAVSVGSGANTSVFRVTIPDNVSPGQEFQVYVGNRIVRVRCPPTSRPGQSLQITVATDPNDRGPSNLPPDSPNVRRIPESEGGSSSQPAYMVEIPPDVRGGQQFPVTIAGQQLMVTCPPNARPGMSLRIVPPPPPTDITRAPEQTMRRSRPQSNSGTQLFKVVVPRGVQPGQPFALLANGVRVLVTCPPNASAGQTIQFNLPTALTNRPTAVNKDGSRNKVTELKLKYDKDGWTRTIRATDLKFQWIRVDNKGDVDLNKRFHIENSAYVRKLDFVDGPDKRMRGGILSLVVATEATVDSRIRSSDGRELVTYGDIASAQVKNFEEKTEWFQETCAALCVEWNEGHMRMNVRREFLLSDSMEAVMSLSRKDLRKVWRFEFIGEAGIDAGGLAREWFQLVTEEIFDPDMGLWQTSANNQMCMQINAASEISCPEDHLVYFRFLGRVMGKALFDRQLIAGRMVQYIYKHILAWPITFADLEPIDVEYYSHLKSLTQYDDLEMLCLDFTTTEETLGVKKTIDLVENGESIDVTNDNLPEYLEACLRYRMIGCVNAQLNELLLGFFDVIPEPLLTIFDFQELELLMCGLPNIDMNDWKENTEYSGEYERIGGDHDACIWFWEVVEEMDQEMRARLLQFVTGTSGVPSRGFGVLQGNDGNIRRFTIHGVDLGTCLYPRAHTCFNRIDLPLYDTKEDLKERLTLAVTMVATGFDIE